jgi:hypothetical protein
LLWDEEKNHPELSLEFGVTSFGRGREVLSQVPFHDYIFGTGSFSVTGEVIDCFVFLEHPWWV